MDTYRAGNNPRLLYYLAQSYRDAQRPTEAIAMYARRAAHPEGNPLERWVAAYQAGRLCQRQGPFAEAIQHLTLATTIAPSRPEAHLALSQVYRTMRRPESALEHAQRAHALALSRAPHGQHAEPWVYQWGAADELATVLSLTGSAAEAITLWERVLGRAPESERQRLEANIAWARTQLPSAIPTHDAT